MKLTIRMDQTEFLINALSEELKLLQESNAKLLSKLLAIESKCAELAQAEHARRVEQRGKGSGVSK